MHLFFPITHLLTTAPLTGDEGMTPILIVAVVGVILVGAFLALTAVQKKRRANGGEDDGE